MKVKDLLKEIQRCRAEYGKDFLEWDVYTEQITTADKKCKSKTKGFQSDWGKVTDGDGWEYFECAGFNTLFTKEKIFTINVNY